MNDKEIKNLVAEWLRTDFNEWYSVRHKKTGDQVSVEKLIGSFNVFMDTKNK